jgi:D-alanine-D-alanine ligase
MNRIPLILFGGASEERLVSVASAQNLMGYIPEATLWFLAPNGEVFEVCRPELQSHQNVFTAEFRPAGNALSGKLENALGLLRDKVVILALHGTEGEDGTLQAMFERTGIPYTGSDSHSSRLAFDKKQTKEIAKRHHIPMADDLLVTGSKDLPALRDFYSQHSSMVLKPVASGSSFGLFIIHSARDFEAALAKLNPGISYLAESFLRGREITVGVRERIDGTIEALPCSEVRVVQGRQFDYEGKYLGSGVQELTPAPLELEDTTRCQELAKKVHTVVGCSGYSRTDMILTSYGPVLLEINTLPGLSKASFIPQQLAAYGENMRQFFLGQIALAEKRRG